MFSREDLECLDPGYFEIICMNDRDVTIMSRNTRHFLFWAELHSRCLFFSCRGILQN